MPQYFLAIDLGGTKCAGAVISSQGKIIHRTEERVAGSGGDNVGKTICKLCRNLANKTNLSKNNIIGVGVSVPGISYKEKGTVWAPNIPGWDNYPLRQMIYDSFEQNLQVEIDSDRTSSILGESWRGAAQGCKNAIYIAFGTGIGAGILSDGHIVRGHSDIAGAIGWMALDDRYPSGYQQFGCFEYNASGDGLCRLAADLHNSHEKYANSMLHPQHLSTREIFTAHEKKDILAVDVLERAIEYWGKGIANLVSIFNPEKIIFGGGLFGPGLKFLDRIHQEARKYAQPIAIEQVELCQGKLGPEAQLYGAARLLMKS